MPLVRTTINPREEVEVDEQEAAVLAHQGLLYAGSRDDLQALLDRDPRHASEPRMVLPPEPPAAKPSASSAADARSATADAKTGV